MANTIKIKNSGTPSASPGSLEHGELGLNYADGKIFFKNLSNTIVEFSTPPNLVVQNTAPANTSVLWADTSVIGVGVVPVGGTTGQVLSKGSNTSYDAVWANAVSSSDLSLKANIASPTFTGTVTIPAGASISGFAPLANAALTGVPTAPTANAATNTTQIATTEFVRTEVANLVASAPAALDTLDELAAALGDDANFATTTATAIGLKAPLASPVLTGVPEAPTATAGTNTTQLATTAFVAAADSVTTPTGSVIAFAGSSAPTNWLLCYGQAVSRTTYATLFAIISTTYGVGDGATTFNLPDLRGRSVAGIDNMGGTDAGRLDIANSSGVVVGSQYVTLTSAQSGLPAHSHASTLTNNAVTSGAGSAHQHTNTLTNATVGSSSHRHDFRFALNDNFYEVTGTMGGMTGSGAYRYSTGAYTSSFSDGSVTDTRQDAGGETVSSGGSGRFASIGDTQTPSATTTVGISNVNESAHTHSVTSNVAISNVNNTAANAAESHSVMQPTMVLNYIIKV